jgi:hypothetical protein
MNQEFFLCVDQFCLINEKFFEDNKIKKYHLKNKCIIEKFTDIREKIINKDSEISKLIESS